MKNQGTAAERRVLLADAARVRGQQTKSRKPRTFKPVSK